MTLFNLAKKKEDGKKPACACNTPPEGAKDENCCGYVEETSATETECCGCANADAKLQNIKVLGAGCKSCHEMYENTKKALKNMEIDIEVEYITDMEKVMAYGIMSMPGLVVNEKIVSVGKVLKPADIEKILHKIGA